MLELANIFKGDFRSLMGPRLSFHDEYYSTGGDSRNDKVMYHAGVVVDENNEGEGVDVDELEAAEEVYRSESYNATVGINSGGKVPFNTAINSVSEKDDQGRVGYFAETDNQQEALEIKEAFVRALIAMGCKLDQDE